MLKKIKSSAKNWVLESRNKLSVGRSFKKLTMCKKCYTFYYKNSWHFYKPINFKIDRDEEIPVRFTDCSSCLEEESAQYETETELAYEMK